MGHGSGGKLTSELIRKTLASHYSNTILDRWSDAAIVNPAKGSLAITTDGFVVNPIFFPGGDIGKLSVCGTVNDLAVAGAQPLYLTLSLILEEGMDLDDLEQIAASVGQQCLDDQVQLVAGDTKVVHRGQCDKVFITTTGIGRVLEGFFTGNQKNSIQPGDHILISGTVGDHGASIFSARYPDQIFTPILSDCASLFPLLNAIQPEAPSIRFMRDPTRGGLATVMAEIVEKQAWGVLLEESRIPYRSDVAALCELTGFDPLYLANEGKMVIITDPAVSEVILDKLRKHPLGREAQRIGRITVENRGKTVLQTAIGGKRLLTMLTTDQLPRIC